MNARFLCTVFAALLGGTAVFAQFDFGKLSKALDKAKDVGDKAKDVGKVAKGFTGIPIEEEREIGDSVALEVIGKYGGLVRDEEIMRRVNMVGLALARYSDRPDLDWRFGVLNSTTVNAFSAPAGFVFITHGLYDTAKNDDELAAILCHEIGHITGRHALKIVARADAVGSSVKLVASRSADTRQFDAQLSQLGLKIDKILNTIFEKGYDPQWEYAADQDGRKLAIRAGYAAGGLRAVLTQLQQHGGDPKAVFSTHPPLADRIKRLPDEPAPKS